ncbi:hypothetical protein F9C07_2844 [Aspergillus flavus]|uniref:Uncharacterized protein n=3 Tax=Aspergillus subgen. Circumdati TaxID=2720871 RepID=A0A7U2MEN5_ASPFN|nr:unnamed protein product [Aspergillus oryzae RIB40]EIT73392.1 hypothetical protein Ao3042_10624 [Aspergillus oryzae 3.042]KDE78128.1 hypothetical protein AO1008_04529 [Aspergillus oryzae 100-8]QRD82236.1 hypothetical protein F9C07_2844 [Aspergillus flavus]BAE57539.1 unnamed protein product [Aspergillus oryzae RIB40]|eukprot:EIT73392.1 hypothetical protein Ao3042_10624 [Aspergillus oryzae 3.042]
MACDTNQHFGKAGGTASPLWRFATAAALKSDHVQPTPPDPSHLSSSPQLRMLSFPCNPAQSSKLELSQVFWCSVGLSRIRFNSVATFQLSQSSGAATPVPYSRPSGAGVETEKKKKRTRQQNRN